MLTTAMKIASQVEITFLISKIILLTQSGSFLMNLKRNKYPELIEKSIKYLQNKKIIQK